MHYTLGINTGNFTETTTMNNRDGRQSSRVPQLQQNQTLLRLPYIGLERMKNTIQQNRK
jgi:hypothetical protein